MTAARGERSLPATFYRGGTSKGLVFAAQDLPEGQEDRDAAFTAAMGSPDPNGRQLDGMGGGYSSVSKVLIVGRSEVEGADVDYTFAQVLVNSTNVDYSSNCGNMLAAVGPFALERGLVPFVPSESDDGLAVVRIYNTNTRKLVHATFPVGPCNALDGRSEPPYTPVPALGGDYTIDGVSGTHARITLDFIAPHGAKTGKLFPTGKATETLSVAGGDVTVTIMDCGNPCVFVRASQLQLDPHVLPPALEGQGAQLARLNDIRNAAAVAMGLAKTREQADAKRSVPKVVVVAPRATHKVLSGAEVGESAIDFVVRCVSAGDPHRALPITAALCTAAAAQVPGTLVAEVWEEGGGKAKRASDAGVVIGHASGTIEVDADVERGSGLDDTTVPRARVFRTARKLFEGRVFY